MAHKTVTIKQSNNALHMDSVVNTIEGKDGHLSEEEKKRYPIKAFDNNSPAFKLVEGTEYWVSVVIRQKNGQKYKLSVVNATSSDHPTDEIELDGGFDIWAWDMKA